MQRRGALLNHVHKNGYKQAVVVLHGIWMTALEMKWLARRIERCGFTVYRFGYASIRRSPAQNARLLQTKVNSIDADTVHFVAHSLGGIVLLHLFDQFPQQRRGKVVFLGTPLQGSALAQRVASSRWLRPLLGRSLDHGVLGDVPALNEKRESLMIAATRRFGIGTLLMPFALPKPSDGTVTVAETQAPWLSQHKVAHTSHLGLVMSNNVAQMICRFLQSSDA
ncbi:MAG: alpha/beta hydrolase [Gammaproteobacteria bacterium]|jgi:pimeloyl-ACP methyl ester carboxylesterase